MSWFQSMDDEKTVEEHVEIFGDALTEWGASVRDFVWPFAKSRKSVDSVDHDADTAELSTAPTLTTLGSMFATSSTLAPNSARCLLPTTVKLSQTDSATTVKLSQTDSGAIDVQCNLRDLPHTKATLPPTAFTPIDELPTLSADCLEATPASKNEELRSVVPTKMTEGETRQLESSDAICDVAEEVSQVAPDVWIDTPDTEGWPVTPTRMQRRSAVVGCRELSPAKVRKYSANAESPIKRGEESFSDNRFDYLADGHSEVEDDACERATDSPHSPVCVVSPTRFGPRYTDVDGHPTCSPSRIGSFSRLSRFSNPECPTMTALPIIPATSSTAVPSATLLPRAPSTCEKLTERAASVSELSVADEALEDALSPSAILRVTQENRPSEVSVLAELQTTVSQLREELLTARRDAQELRETLEAKETDAQALQNELARTAQELSDAQVELSTCADRKAEMIAVEGALRKARDELQAERREKEDWMTKTEKEYDELREDLMLARQKHLRDNEMYGKVIATQASAIEWLETMRNLLIVQLELSAATQRRDATVTAQRIVKQVVDIALSTTVVEAPVNKLSFVETMNFVRSRSWLSLPAGRRTQPLHDILSPTRRTLIEGAYLIKNGKIADRFPPEKYDVLDNYTLRYVNGVVNPSVTKPVEPLSYDLLDELQQPRGSRAQFFIFSLLSAVKDAFKKQPCDEHTPGLLYGYCLTFPFVRRTEDAACRAEASRNIVLGTMGMVLISRFPLVVLFRDLLQELFHSNYIQLDARLRRLLRGKKPETMAWSDAARQLLRISYSQCWQSSSSVTIPIPPYFGRENDALTHLPESEKGDQICATEMLGDVLAPWSQYRSAFIDVLAAFMLERKVVITSSNIQRGSLLCVALRALISPFIWHHVFQPCMPLSLVGELPMMDAPFPFLAHIHTDDLPKDCPSDVVICALNADGLTVANVEKDVFPPKLLALLRNTDSPTSLVHVFAEALRDLHAALDQWGQTEGTQPMDNAKAFIKRLKLPLFRSANDEFLPNFFETQQCCAVVDAAICNKSGAGVCL